MADSSAPEVASKLGEAQSGTKILEGVDFIETEEDAEAVESAVVKIQSTFRGKKIRSKLNQKPAAAGSGTATEGGNDPKPDNNQRNKSDSKGSTSDQAEASKGSETKADASIKANAATSDSSKQDEELNNKVATMQVNDNSGASGPQDNKSSVAGSNALPKEEAAAAKIQAGFKGYKTRKELESKLGQQAAPADGDAGQGAGAASVRLDKGD